MAGSTCPLIRRGPCSDANGGGGAVPAWVNLRYNSPKEERGASGRGVAADQRHGVVFDLKDHRGVRACREFGPDPVTVTINRPTLGFWIAVVAKADIPFAFVPDPIGTFAIAGRPQNPTVWQVLFDAVTWVARGPERHDPPFDVGFKFGCRHPVVREQGARAEKGSEEYRNSHEGLMPWTRPRVQNRNRQHGYWPPIWCKNCR